MHEISIARSLLELLNDQRRVCGSGRILRATVMLGPLSGVDGTALQSTFSLIVAGTPVEGCALEIKTAALSGKCSSCSNEFEIRHYQFVCPACQSNAIELASGNEILLSEIEVEPVGEQLCLN